MLFYNGGMLQNVWRPELLKAQASGRLPGAAEDNMHTGTHRMLQIQYPQLEVVHSRDVSSGRMNDEIMVHVYDSNQLA